MGRQLERHTNKNHHFGLQAFLIALVTACVLIIPFIIFDGGTGNSVLSNGTRCDKKR